MSSQLLTFFLLLSIVAIHHLPVVICEPWCVAMPSSTPAQLQANIEYACTRVECKAIQPRGICYYPNTLLDHASYVMNSFYLSQGRNDDACSFGNTGYLIYTDPSVGTCVY